MEAWAGRIVAFGTEVAVLGECKHNDAIMNFIEVKDVVKAYDGHLALDHVSLEVPKGSIYGLLGPNGAGKTTLIRIINKITNPDSGEVTFDGRPMRPDDIAMIGYLPEERGLYKKMKVGEEIVYLARLKGMPKAIAEQQMRMWLDRFGLSEWRNRKVETLSKGMQQKVQFIATVIHRPQLLIFDEPFSGFDPVNAEQLKREILNLKDEGSTIIFSTHNMESVEEVCEQITLINHSKAVLQGRVDEIRHKHKKNVFVVGVGQSERLAAREGLFAVLEAADGMRLRPNESLIRLDAGVELHDAIAYLNDNYHLDHFAELLPSMNEIFIETVKNLNV